MLELPWFPWSNEYREDEWFLTLTMGQRWAWVALLSRANETAWAIPDKLLRALRVTARLIQCDESDLAALVESAKAAKKLIQQPDGSWLVPAGDKYREQKQRRENADRQKRHRDIALRVTESNLTPHHTTPQDNKDNSLSRPNDEEKKINGSFDHSDIELVRSSAEIWNKFCDQATNMPKVRIETLLQNETRMKHAVKRLKQVSIQDLISAIRSSPHHMGKNDSGWTADFDWIMSNKTRMEALVDRFKTTRRESLARG